MSSKEVLYFQGYVTKENIATNNTLLLLKRIYNYRPSLFYASLGECISEDLNSNIDLGVVFKNQEKNDESIPDGVISQSGIKIVIETKRSKSTFGSDQLVRHLTSFNKENYIPEIEILLALSDGEIDNALRTYVEGKIKEFNQKTSHNVVFISLTFQELIDALNNNVQDYEHEIKEVIDDYSEFCKTSGLIRHTWMVARTAGSTLENDLKYGIYYDSHERDYDSEFFGLYTRKAVIAVGKVQKILTLKDGKLEAILHSYDGHKTLTEEQTERLNKAINELNLTWDSCIYLVDNFEKTNFYKSGKFAIQSKKYFDLDYIIEQTDLKGKKAKDLSSKELAQLLNDKSWEEFKC